eukprot:257920-Hanusia_phi.AAC.3
MPCTIGGPIAAGHADRVRDSIVITEITVGAVVARPPCRSTVPYVAEAIGLVAGGGSLAGAVGYRLLVIASAALVAGGHGVSEALQALAVELETRAHLGDAVAPAGLTGEWRRGGLGRAVEVRLAGRAVGMPVGGLVAPCGAGNADPILAVIPRVAHAGGQGCLVQAETRRVQRACRAVRELVGCRSANGTGRTGRAVSSEMPNVTLTGGDAGTLFWATGIFWALVTSACVACCIYSRVGANRADVAVALVVQRGEPTAPALVTGGARGRHGMRGACDALRRVGSASGVEEGVDRAVNAAVDVAISLLVLAHWAEVAGTHVVLVPRPAEAVCDAVRALSRVGMCDARQARRRAHLVSVGVARADAAAHIAEGGLVIA